MDIKELDKRQLILLTLLITFVVSIATGIVTVSLMNQMPKSVPQTINNVIQRTIEKVTTVEQPVALVSSEKIKESTMFSDNGELVVSIYIKNGEVSIPSVGSTTIVTTPGITPVDNTNNGGVNTDPKLLGQGIIISDIGLILVDSSLLNESKVYRVVLNKIDFDATIVKKFSNGFTILKISEKKTSEKVPTEAVKTTTAN